MAKATKPNCTILLVEVLDEKDDQGYNKTVNTKIGVAWRTKGGAETLKFKTFPIDPNAIIKILPS